MKLKVGEKVYLQNYDIAFIVYELDSLPIEISNELFSKNDIFHTSGRNNNLRFEYSFEDPEAIEWLMSRDWIIDFDEYIDKSLSELESLLDQLCSEHSAKTGEFNTKSVEYRKEHYDEETDEYNKREHRIDSLHLLINFRKGEIGFVFPKEYQNSAVTSTPKKPGFFAWLSEWLFGQGAH